MVTEQNPRWHPDELAHVAAHYLTQSDAQIGKALGRTRQAVSGVRTRQGLFRAGQKPSSLTGRIAEHWGKIPADEIAVIIGISETRVRDIAAKGGLGASGFRRAPKGAQSPVVRTNKPRGITPEQIEWADMNGGLEAQYIRGMARDGILLVREN